MSPTPPSKPPATNADIVHARFETLRKLGREMREIGSGERQPTQFQVVSDGEFTRIRVIEGLERVPQAVADPGAPGAEP